MPELPLGPLMVDVCGTRLGAAEKRLLSRPAIGAVILFSRNFHSRSQVTGLIEEIKSVRTPSLLIAVDQEGGRVQRFKRGFYRLPAAHRLGRHYDNDPESAVKLSKSAGCLMAAELMQIGVDFSFAPVLDRANLASQVIGDRGFHVQPAIIAALAGAFIQGMAQAGMAATSKHFPGHGGVVDDSHHTLPVDRRSLQQLAGADLIPFKKLAALVGGMMTAHVQYAEIDRDIPAFSRFWLYQIVRREMAFKGMIFSDDLSMKGAQVAGDAVQRTTRALNAGCDMVLICNDPDSAVRVAHTLGDCWPVNQPRLELMRAAPGSRIVDTAALRHQLDQLA